MGLRTGRISKADLWTILVAGRRVGAFAIVPSLAIITPLLVTPVISRRFHEDGVIAVAIGQSIGSVAGILVALGWPLLGPASVARAGGNERAEIYNQSLMTRYLALAACAPIAGAISAGIVGALRLETAVTAVAFAAYGLTATWYYAGAGDAKGLLACEALPRFVATAAAALFLWLGGAMLWYPLLLGMAVVVSNLLNTRRILRSSRLQWRWRLSDALAQLPATMGRFVNGVYSAGATSVVGLMAPSAVFEYAAIARIQRPALSASAAVPQGLMSWAVGAPGRLKSRQQMLLFADATVAIVLGVTVFLILPSIADFMFDGLLNVDPILNAITSAGIAAGFMARALLMHGLTPAELGSFSSVVLTISSAIGLAGTIVGAASFGVDGALGAFAAAEMLFCICAIARMWAYWKTSNE